MLPGTTDPTLKPLWGTQLDTNHPLSRGLDAYWLFNEGIGPSAVDIVAGYTISLGSNIVWSAQGVGNKAGTAGGATFGVNAPNQNGFTLFCTAYVTGNSVLPNGRIFNICNVSLSANYGGTVNGLGLMIEGGTWTYSNLNAVLNRPVHLCVTTSGNTYTFYVDGKQAFQNAFGHPNKTGAGSLTYYDSAASSSNGLLSAGFYGNRILSASDVAELAAAPYQMTLTPATRRFYSVGGTLYTRTLTATTTGTAQRVLTVSATRTISTTQAVVKTASVAVAKIAATGETAKKTATISASKTAATGQTATKQTSVQATRKATTPPGGTLALLKTRLLTLAASTTQSAFVQKSVGKMWAASTTLSANVSTLKARFLTLAASTTQTASVRRSIAATRAVVQTTSSVVSKSIGTIRKSSATATATLSALKARFLTFAASTPQSATVAKGVSTIHSAVTMQAGWVRKSLSKTWAALATQGGIVATVKNTVNNGAAVLKRIVLLFLKQP